MSHPPPSDATNDVTARLRQMFDEGQGIAEAVEQTGLTRAAVKHYFIEWKQARDIDGSAIHSEAKSDLAKEALARLPDRPEVLELFAGPTGFMTRVYEEAGCRVTALDKRRGTGDSYHEVYRLIVEKRRFDLIDVDPYGYPFRLFPHVFQLMENGVMLLTIPKTGCNYCSNITYQMLQAFTGTHDPGLERLLTCLWSWGLQYWREVNLIRGLDFGRIWRLALDVRKVKATEFCNVRNRPELPPSVGSFKSGPDLTGLSKKMLLPDEATARDLFDLAFSGFCEE